MLLKKQMEKLPNGINSNTEIAKLFPRHGLKSREMTFPVNKKGEIVNTLLEENQEFKTMRLNRQMHRKHHS